MMKTVVSGIKKWHGLIALDRDDSPRITYYDRAAQSIYCLNMNDADRNSTLLLRDDNFDGAPHVPVFEADGDSRLFCKWGGAAWRTIADSI